MIRLFQTTSFVLIAGLLISCDPCRNLDCLASKYDFEFRILDAESGLDLVFGPNAQFKAEEFRLYSLQGNEQVEYVLQPLFSPYYEGDTTFYAEVIPPLGPVFLSYPNGKIDTLVLSYTQYDTECCGRITEVRELTRNNSEKFNDLWQILEFSY
ncbi:hypothetical protein Aoki45_34430 [Algoriphagus sp. oki45]|uniref:hypothetical protein n=1 Tax=Algoriphagus sp. oki45 TaxID=3067294 RepID=UPI0027F5E199|nr:hypothetical protein Aoki45_34430 [Algoriphagus sp. oki45]